MDWSEFRFRAGQVILLVGILAYVASQATFDLQLRRGIALGLVFAFALRAAYIMLRHGWEAAENDADKTPAGLGIATLAVCAILATPY